MSLAIDVDNVSAVLLADGWHTVMNDSFMIDAYEYLWWAPELERGKDDPMILHGGGQSDICASGFEFKDSPNTILSGPLSAILAVRGKVAKP